MKKLILVAILVLPVVAFSQVTAPATAPSGLILWLQTNATLVLGILWGLAETLALIPSLKSNSVFTLIYNLLQGLNKPTTPKV